MMEQQHYLVPEQATGTEINLITKLVIEDTAEAAAAFVDAKDSLLNVNNWDCYCTDIHFSLADHRGHPGKRLAHKGDYIIANIPAQDTVLKEETDWIHIDAIEYDDYPDTDSETFALRVHLARSPFLKDLPGTALDTVSSGSTFVVARSGTQLSVSYHGRNTLPAKYDNTSYALQWFSIDHKVWQCLIDGFLNG